MKCSNQMHIVMERIKVSLKFEDLNFISEAKFRSIKSGRIYKPYGVLEDRVIKYLNKQLNNTQLYETHRSMKITIPGESHEVILHLGFFPEYNLIVFWENESEDRFYAALDFDPNVTFSYENDGFTDDFEYIITNSMQDRKNELEQASIEE